MRIRRLRGRWREEIPATAWRWLLLPAWLVFRPLVVLRNWLFDQGWRTTHRLPVPVWSVGNLTAGGTGKTPLTRHLAKWAIAHGLRPAIISRGYRAAPDGTNDEARTVSECPVVCDADRVAGGRRAIADGATCLILDDGFQHRRLHRDLDLVLIDATRPWGTEDPEDGATLPLGYLREGRRALRRADLLVLTRTELVSSEWLELLQTRLGALLGKKQQSPLIRVADFLPRLRQPGSDSTAEVKSLKGQPVILVSGLGNPLGFERAASKHGWLVHESLRFPDHHHYDQSDVTLIRAAATQHAAVVVTTGKDAVKLVPLFAGQPALDLQVLEVDSTIHPDDRQALDQRLLATLPNAPTV